MRGGKRRIVGALVAGALVGLSGVTACSVGSVGSYGCTDRDKGFADRLNELAVLELHPPGSALTDQGVGCDDDDGFAWAGKVYRPASGTDVLAYYRQTLPTQGWKLESVDDDPVEPDALVISGARLCFTRTIEGTDAYLAIWFPSDFGEKTDDFGIQVTASHDGDAWC